MAGCLARSLLLPVKVACVMKTRSFQMIGVELPVLGRGTRQRTFWLVVHSRGAMFLRRRRTLGASPVGPVCGEQGVNGKEKADDLDSHKPILDVERRR